MMARARSAASLGGGAASRAPGSASRNVRAAIVRVIVGEGACGRSMEGVAALLQMTAGRRDADKPA